MPYSHGRASPVTGHTCRAHSLSPCYPQRQNELRENRRALVEGARAGEKSGASAALIRMPPIPAGSTAQSHARRSGSPLSGFRRTSGPLPARQDSAPAASHAAVTRSRRGPRWWLVAGEVTDVAALGLAPEPSGAAGRPERAASKISIAATASIRKPSSGLPLTVVNRAISSRIATVGCRSPAAALPRRPVRAMAGRRSAARRTGCMRPPQHPSQRKLPSPGMFTGGLFATR